MEQSSRTVNSLKNITWGYLGTFLNLFLSFISRTVFISILGITYLGINGLFTNVLNILSFSELGIGVAMNYSLYKPVAEGNTEQIRSLMYVYKKAYRYIALTITIIGLVLMPFLRNLVTGANGISNFDLQIYYLIFLFNTVSSYFVTYKYGLVNAEQKNYILTNIDSLSRICITTIQIVVLYLFQNFFVYLLIQAFFQLVQKIVTSIYLNRKYNYLLEGKIQVLDSETKQNLVRNIKALILHKIGEICVYQTDNILISMFISVTVVGLVSNYFMVITAVTGFINIAMNGIISSCGNLIATEGIQKKIKIFNVYDLVGFWLYSFETIAFVILFQPFITIWIGSDKQIDNLSLMLLLGNNYLVGQRAAAFNYKSAAGIFSPDKYASIVQSILNLGISIYGVIQWGLPGIYLGTLLSGLIITVCKPYVLYKYLFKQSSWLYFRRLFRNALITIGIILLLEWVKGYVLYNITIVSFVLMTIITSIVTNAIFVLFFWHSAEFVIIKEKCKILMKREKNNG